MGIQKYTESQREYANVTRKLGINIRSWRYGFEVAHGLPLGGEDSLLLLSDIAASSSHGKPSLSRTCSYIT